MGHYMACTPKRHICWSNSPKIGGLDKGCLTKAQREEIRLTGIKSAKVRVNKKGKKHIVGHPDFVGLGAGLSVWYV